MKHTYIEVFDLGDSVICDICGADYTTSNESGGFLFGSYAYCPKCAVESLKTIHQYNEQKYIKEFCPPNLSFREWCLQLRAGENTIRMIMTKNESN